MWISKQNAPKTAADKLSQTLGETMTVGALEELFKNLSHVNPCPNREKIILFLHGVSKIQEIRPHFQRIFTKTNHKPEDWDRNPSRSS